MKDYELFGPDEDGLEVVRAGCMACQHSNVILEGHFLCWPTDREIVRGPILTSDGWFALVKK